MSCETKSKTELQITSLSNNISESFDLCIWNDIKKEVTPESNYFDFKKIADDKYLLEWGNKNLSRILLDTFYCESPSTSRPTFEKENQKYIVLRFGCGSPCWGTIFLPLNEKQEPKKIHYHYDFDLERDLVIYLDSDESNPTITTYNLITKNILKHKVDFRCESAIPTYCLDSLWINRDKVYYRWTSDFQTNKQEEGIFNINNL
jgi:hypothetical protein